MSPAVFTPPVVYDVPRVLPETRGVARLLMRHYSPLPRGRSVLLVNGHYEIVDSPDTTGLTEGVHFFLGGHEYVIGPDIAEALEDDGFIVEHPGTWGSYAGTQWGALQSDFWAAP